MAINKAAQALEDLINLGPERPPVDPGETGEAGFAALPAAVTAIGASAILGPVAGLVLGGVQGILGKRARQDELDRAAEEAEILAQSDDIAAAVFDSQRMAAQNPADLRQLDVLQSQYAVASKMLRSDVPETRARGAQLMQQVMGAQRAYEVQNETQLIAAEQREEDALRALGQENYSRYTDSRDNFMAESQQYLEVRGATVNLVDAIERGTAIDQYAAIKLVEKALDPTSVVRPEEQQAWGGLASAMERANIWLERLKSGKSLSPEQLAGLKNLALSIEGQAFEIQKRREARYHDEIIDIGLPAKFHDNFRLAEPLNIAPAPVADAGDGANGETPDVLQAAVAAGLVTKDVVDRIPSEVKAAVGTAGLMTGFGKALVKLAAKYAVPVTAVIAAGEQVPGESDQNYRMRLRRAMESAPHDERRDLRPVN